MATYKIAIISKIDFFFSNVSRAVFSNHDAVSCVSELLSCLLPPFTETDKGRPALSSWVRAKLSRGISHWRARGSRGGPGVVSNSCSRLTGEGGDSRQSGGAGAGRRGGIEHISQSSEDTNTHYITEYMLVRFLANCLHTTLAVLSEKAKQSPVAQANSYKHSLLLVFFFLTITPLCGHSGHGTGELFRSEQGDGLTKGKLTDSVC